MEFLQQLAHIPQPLGHQVKHGFVIGLGKILSQPRHLDLGTHLHGTAIQIDLTGQHFHQAGLAGPIAAYQAESATFFNRQVNAIQQHLQAITELGIF